MRARIKGLLIRILGLSEKELEEKIDWLEKEGYLEVVGYDHGEKILKTTEKGLKFLEEHQGRRI